MPRPLGFLDLPAEIRRSVYSFIALDDDSIVNRPLPAAAALIPTCRTLHDEFLMFLFSSKLVVLDNHSGELVLKEISLPQVSDIELRRTKGMAQLSPLAAESVNNASYKILRWCRPVTMHDMIAFEHRKLQKLFEQCPNLQSLRLEFHYDINESWVATLLHLAVLILHSQHTKTDKTRLCLHHLHICPGCRAPHLAPRLGAQIWSLQWRLEQGVLCDATSQLRLPSKLQLIEVVPPTKIYPEICRFMQTHSDDSNDLITSLRLPQQHAITKTSGTSSDEMWTYELKSIQPGSTGQALVI